MRLVAILVYRLAIPAIQRRAERYVSFMAVDREQEFHGAMVNIYQVAKRDLHYNATRFIQMVAEQGGVGAARQLLHASTVSDGFSTLWLAKRLDLSVEAHVIRPEYAELFTAEERNIAQRRLEEYGYRP